MGLSDIFKIDEYKKTIADLQSNLAGKEAELSTAAEDLQNKETQIGSLTQELETKEAAFSAEQTTLRRRIDTLSEELIAKAAELAEINAVLTDEHKCAIDINRYIAEQECKRNALDADVAAREEEKRGIEQSIEELKDTVIELEDTKLLQDFGLYTPTYNWATAAEYKEHLDAVRSQQKEMIRNNTAATCSTVWVVNNDKREGARMVKNTIKQTILTFNMECENAISAVKFSNFDSMKDRIYKAYNKLNNLNEINEIIISPAFLDLKLQELALAYEHAQKVQQEKEYVREQRAIARENARVQRELEEQRRKLEKEQAHYNNMLARLREQLEAEENEARKEFITEKINAAEEEVESIDKAIADVDYRQANERAGYVYVISNIGAFGEGIYKIGMTRRLEPLDRIDELGGASVPFRFDVHALIFSSDAPKLETALHNAFADRRVNMINPRKEFYRVPLHEIEEVVRRNHDRSVEFNYTACAQQYRESIKMREK